MNDLYPYINKRNGKRHSQEWAELFPDSAIHDPRGWFRLWVDQIKQWIKR